MRITVLNEIEFIRRMSTEGIIGDGITSRGDIYIISINYPYEGTGYFKKEYENVLNLYFDDTETNVEIYDDDINEVRELIPLSINDGRRIISFLEKIPNGVDELIIHCKAGVSRSGAIGLFANDFFRMDYHRFMERNPRVRPNQHVVRVLNNLYFGRC